MARMIAGTDTSNSPLKDKLNELIARDLGISPDEITPEFMRDWREKNLDLADKVALKDLREESAAIMRKYAN